MNTDDNTGTRQEKNEEEKDHFFWKAMEKKEKTKGMISHIFKSIWKLKFNWIKLEYCHRPPQEP